MYRPSTVGLALVLASIVMPAAAGCQARTTSQTGATPTQTAAATSRDSWQRVPDIFAALGATPGSRVADLGAGEGWLTVRLARQVGDSGRVFASDISERALNALAERLDSADIENVELMLATEEDPRLPHGTLDGVVIVNAYHEMTRRVPVLAGVKRALRPGGVLVIVDNVPADSLRTRREQTSRHTLALDLARDDLEAQGFEIISSDPEFITRRSDRHVHREWILVARRPAQ